MKLHGAEHNRRAHESKAADGRPSERSAILHSVAIVSDRHFRLDIELRHPR